MAALTKTQQPARCSPDHSAAGDPVPGVSMWYVGPHHQIPDGHFMTRRRHASAAAAFRALYRLSGCLFLGGCFTLTPVRMDQEIDPGRVRIHLTQSAATRLTSVLGRNVDETLDAEVTQSAGDSLVVQVESGPTVQFGTTALYQELRIPLEDVTGLERRRLNNMRTGLAIGGASALAGFLFYKSVTGKTGGSITPTVPGPSEVLLPILQFWLR